MFKKIKVSLVGDLSIRLKLFTGIIVMALIPIVALGLSGYGFTQYQDVVDSERQADQINTLLGREQNGILQFLSGDRNGEETYAEAHNEFLNVRERIELRSTSQQRGVHSIIQGEQQINLQMYSEGAGLFEEFATALEDFVEKNNKHVARLLGYKDGWVEPGGAENTEVLEILDTVRRERIIVDEFNARSPDATLMVQEFKDTNDYVVAHVSALWQRELEVGISRASSPTLRSMLQVAKRVVGDITATTFPAISADDAKVLGIARNEEALFGLQARTATQTLATAIETSVNDYEADGGFPLWPRNDVADVGEDVTPVLTLSMIISCQQAVRLNADDIFKWKTAYVNDIEPIFFNISNDLDIYLGSLAASVANRAKQVWVFSIIAAGFALGLGVLLMVLFSKVIVKPISIIRDIAVELAQGNFSRRATVKTNDEIGTLAVAFNQMIDNLEKSIDWRDREIAKRKQVEETLRNTNEKLETSVEERTTELIIANQHLIREVTERERAQEALRKSYEELEQRLRGR